MDNKILENLEKLKKMLVLLSKDSKQSYLIVRHLSMLKMRTIVSESIEMASK